MSSSDVKNPVHPEIFYSQSTNQKQVSRQVD